MIQKLKYWLFQRGKSCKHCCLWCEYYDLCSNEVKHEQQIYKTKTTNGTEITIMSMTARERRLQKRVTRKARRENEKF